MKILPQLIAKNLQAVSDQVYQSADDSFEGEFSASSKCSRFQAMPRNELLVSQNRGRLLHDFLCDFHFHPKLFRVKEYLELAAQVNP